MAKSPKPPRVHMVQREQTEVAHFIRRIPADLKERLIGRTVSVAIDPEEVATFSVTKSSQSIRFSLKTSSLKVAKVRAAYAELRLEVIFAELREQKRLDLTHKQVLALAGELYVALATEPDAQVQAMFMPKGFEDILKARASVTEYFELTPHLEAFCQGISARAITEGTAFLQATYGGVAERLLARHGIGSPAPNTKLALVQTLHRTAIEALQVRARYASGDYREDENRKKFPLWENVAPKAGGGDVSLTALLEGWWTEASAAGVTQSTKELYERAINSLATYAGHDDASRIGPITIVDFKDMLARQINIQTGKRLSPRTIRGSYLSGLNSVFKWAVANKKLASNPAEGVTIKGRKPVKVRERDFTKEEATAILKSCLALGTPRFLTGLVQKWAPWLCAYTGARIGEIVQLRKEDVTYDASLDSWVIRITPEAHTVKTKEFRLVPVHPHLIELGFVEECLKSDLNADHDYIFMPADKGDEVRGQWRSKKNRVAEFVRQTVKDPNVAPNHGWRHTFKSIGFEVGIQEKVLDELCGHAPASIGRGYGSVTLKTKVEAIRAFPRWLVADEQRTEVTGVPQVSP